MVCRRSFVPAGRGLLYAALVLVLGACGTFDRVDESADKAVARVEVAADRAIDAAASRASVLVADSVRQAEAAASRLLAETSSTLLVTVEKLPAVLAAGVKAQADAAASRATEKIASALPAEDRAAFKRDVEENGLLKAVREWWIEIVLSFFGAGGTFKALLSSRRARRERERAEREAVLARAAVEAIETSGDKRIKDAVQFKTAGLAKSMRDAVAARVQEIVSLAKSGKQQ